MSSQVVVLGAGYAGVGAVQRFADAVEPGEAELTWISEHDYHLVLHEVHRVVRDPDVERSVALPIEDVKPPSAEFVRDRAVGVDVDERTVALDGGDTVDYDYLLVALGSRTAFYGIDGLREHSLTLKGLDDARRIHRAVDEAAAAATADDPAEVVVGGAGLSGIQTAGELAALRDDRGAPIEVTLVEGLDQVFPGNDPEVQGALRKRLQERGIGILTGDFISKVDDDVVYLGGGEDVEPTELGYDVLVWTGGITGPEEAAAIGVDRDERSHRIHAASDFRTSDDRVLSIGDSALIEQGTDDVAPPTAQAAWQAAAVAGRNLARAVRGEPLRTWQYEDKGTLVSVGEEAVAHDVAGVPINTFGGPAATFLKKAVAARWIADAGSVRDAVSAWSDL